MADPYSLRLLCSFWLYYDTPYLIHPLSVCVCVSMYDTTAPSYLIFSKHSILTVSCNRAAEFE